MRRAEERVYYTLQEMIIQQKIRPGMPISEPRLAQMLGVSRTPVREALKRLEADGLIVRNSRGRRFVYALSLKDVHEIFDIKMALEPQLIIWAMEKGSPTELQKLNEIADKMISVAECTRDGAPVKEVVDEWLSLDTAFHNLIYSMARNERAATIIKSLNTQWQRLKEGIVALQGRIAVSAKEHKLIANLMLAGDKDAAQQAMARHLENVRAAVITILKAAGFPE